MSEGRRFMTSLTRYAIGLALVFYCVGLFPRAQSQTKTAKKGSVAGKVTIRGKAAPGIVVSLRVSDSGSPFESSYKGTTDQEGKFRLTEIPAGIYQLVPIAPAFVVADGTGSRGQTVVLSEGE